MPAFLPGLELCRLFYEEAVRPLLERECPGVPHAAARVGPGSDVLGFDTERSADHDWGPRLDLFLTPDHVDQYAERLTARFSAELPKVFLGWPTNFEPPGARVRVMTPTSGPVAHRVEVTDVAGWSVDLLGFDATAEPATQDWLTTPAQRLAEATSGQVFHDSVGSLTALRARLNWYPDDVWRYVLAAQWMRIAQEEAFVGRAVERGDELGTRVVAARLVRELMRLFLLLERRFPPYTKWLSTAYTGLPDVPSLTEVLQASDPQPALCAAYEAAGRRQNELGLAVAVDPTRRPYFDRPFLVIDAGRFATALRDRIRDDSLKDLPLIGAIDQYVDSTDVLSNPSLCRSAGL